MKESKRGIGFKFALNGLKQAVLLERNFRIHLISTFVVLVLSYILNLNRFEWIIVIFVIGLVLITELVNTAIERLIDYLKPEIHPEAKIIKDVAASIVLLAAAVAFAVGCIIFIPKLVSLFSM